MARPYVSVRREPTTAVVLSPGSRVLVAWKETRKPSGAAVMLMASRDGGVSFAKPREVATAGGISDHPFLIERAGRVLVSWFSAGDGHRMVPID